MSEAFVGEIRMIAGNYAPRGWAFCDGQLVQIAAHDALFSLLGTVYGGDGQNTFGLPDLRGRVPLHAGAGPGLSPVELGAAEGVEQVTLTSGQMPAHTHPFSASQTNATTTAPAGHTVARAVAPVYANDTAEAMAPTAVANAGGDQPHTNLQPFTCVHFIIALFGSHPSRS